MATITAIEGIEGSSAGTLRVAGSCRTEADQAKEFETVVRP